LGRAIENLKRAAALHAAALVYFEMSFVELDSRLEGAAHEHDPVGSDRFFSSVLLKKSPFIELFKVRDPRRGGAERPAVQVSAYL
jgi:hypothetical protein